MTAVFNTKGRSGQQKKRITVNTNDAENPRVFMTLEGTVVADILVEPRSLSFDQLSRNENGSQEFTVQIAEPEVVTISSVKVEDERFEVEPQGGDGAGNYKYKLNFKGSNEVSRIVTRVNVEVTGGATPTMTLPVRASIVGDLRYAKSIFFIKRDNGFSYRDITFSSRANTNVKILDVKDADKALKFEVLDNDTPTAKIRVDVAAPEASYTPPKRGNLVVKTSSADEPEIEISYMISERRAPSKLPGRPASPDAPVPDNPSEVEE